VHHTLLVFFSNFVPKTHRFSDQKCGILKTGLGVRQGHWKCHRSTERIGLPIDANFFHPRVYIAPLKGFPLELCTGAGEK